MSTGFYVSVMNGTQRGLLLGPYPHQSDALANVDRARDLACVVDPWAHHYTYGTAIVANGSQPLPPGRMNEVLGLWPCALCDAGIVHTSCIHDPHVHVGACADRSH